MKCKNIIKTLLVALLLMGSVLGVSASEEPSKAPPITTHAVKKTVTVSGITVNLQVTFRQSYLGSGEYILSYVDNSAKITSVSSGTAQIKAVSSTPAVSQRGDCVSVVIYYTLSKTGTKEYSTTITRCIP